MGRRSRCLCALLAWTALLAAAGLVPRTASADDWGDPPQSAQTSSSTSSATAQNDSSTTQRAAPTQIGGSQQTQTTIQAAPTQQTADASSRSSQSAANVASGGAAKQENTSSSGAVARNVNQTSQSSAQKQADDAPPPDPAPSETQSQTSSQSAPTTQHADATATSNQVAPTNINISVRIDSPGDNGPVDQTNTSTASATSDNANTVTQVAKQDQNGSSRPGSQSQAASQDAPTTQVATATSTSTQVAPTNLNITIRNKSPGDDGAVTQTNASQSNVNASNANAADQGAVQAQDGAGSTSAPTILGGNGSPHTYIPRGHTSYPPTSSLQPASGGTTQSQVAAQSASTTQTGTAAATSVQDTPTNGDVSLGISEGASDPNGSGRRGTLIQIFIPEVEATQTNTSSAGAAAVNSNRTTQTADQRQTAPSGGDTQVGGASQIQIVQQSAPTTQSANARATSDQSGALNLAAGSSAAQTNTTLSKATVDNSSQTMQSAVQIQDGGIALAGSQVQIVEQIAPTVQTVIAEAFSNLSGATNLGADGWSIQTNVSSATVSAGKSNQTTQSAQQIQVGTSEGGSSLQVIEQSSANAVGAHVRETCKRRCASSSSATFVLGQDLTVWSSSKGEDTSQPTKESGSSRQKTQRASRDERLPRAPGLPGVGAGTSSGGGGGSLWIFAALLIPFALTAPWWARRHGPSAFRRLTGVVVRPERPG